MSFAALSDLMLFTSFLIAHIRTPSRPSLIRRSPGPAICNAAAMIITVRCAILLPRLRNLLSRGNFFYPQKWKPRLADGVQAYIQGSTMCTGRRAPLP